jgi:hypothetical protein
MRELKHVGRSVTNGRKVLVAYRTLPGESDSCLVIPTESLTDPQHDAIISLVESSAAQNAYEFAEVLARSQFPDGSIMLANLHVNKKLMKVRTDAIEMTPTFQVAIRLDQLNAMIAEQRGVAVNDLAIISEKPTTEVQTIAEVSTVPPSTLVENLQPLDDEALAKKYRSDADRLAKEAAHYRKMAEELVPSKRKKKA